MADYSDSDILAWHDKHGFTFERIGGLIGKSAAAVRVICKSERNRQAAQDPSTIPDDIDRLMRLAEAATRALAEVDPVKTHDSRDFQTDEPIAIMMAGCLQLGGRYTFHELVRQALDSVFDDPRFYYALFGDEIEGFISGSFAGASAVHEQALHPKLQIKLWQKMFNRIATRTVFGCGSQHATIWMEKTGVVSPVKDTYVEKGITFFDGQGYYQAMVGDQVYQFAVAHEFPGMSIHNPTHAQRRALWQRYPMADVVAMADKHQYAVTHLEVYGNEVEAGNRPSPEAWLVQIGTTKVGPDKYTIRGWERGQFGWPIVILWPNTHKAVVVREVGHARVILDNWRNVVY